MKDYDYVIQEFLKQALPRYIEGHKIWGDAREHHNLLWWMDEGLQEQSDNLFYSIIARYLASPPEGHQCIYIAGPYRNENEDVQANNVDQARQAMVEVYRKNQIPFSPISMNAWLDFEAPDLPRETFLAVDLVWLKWCQGILILPGWETSEGALLEKATATKMGLEIYYSLDEIPTGAAWDHKVEETYYNEATIVGPREVLDDTEAPKCVVSDPGSSPGGSTNLEAEFLPLGWEEDEVLGEEIGQRRYIRDYSHRLRGDVIEDKDWGFYATVCFGDFVAEHDCPDTLKTACAWCDDKATEFLTVIGKNSLESHKC